MVSKNDCFLAENVFLCCLRACTIAYSSFSDIEYLLTMSLKVSNETRLGDLTEWSLHRAHSLMHSSQSQRANANQVTQVLVQYKDCLFLFKILLLCQCPFKDSFPISFCQLIQRPCDVAEGKYESSIEFSKPRKLISSWMFWGIG